VGTEPVTHSASSGPAIVASTSTASLRNTAAAMFSGGTERASTPRRLS
jgi:hypothetical protein